MEKLKSTMMLLFVIKKRNLKRSFQKHTLFFLFNLKRKAFDNFRFKFLFLITNIIVDFNLSIPNILRRFSYVGCDRLLTKFQKGVVSSRHVSTLSEASYPKAQPIGCDRQLPNILMGFLISLVDIQMIFVQLGFTFLRLLTL